MRAFYTVPGIESARAIGLDYSGPRRVVFVVNNDISFLTHRAVWAAALQSAGSDVTVIAKETGYGSSIASLGFEFIPVDLGRESIGPGQSLIAGLRIFLHILTIRPERVFLSATAAYALGWPAATLLRKTLFIRVAGGVGRALTHSHERPTAQRLVRLLLRLGGRLHNVATLFQLEEDLQHFTGASLASAPRSTVIAGTGVDTDAWLPDLSMRATDKVTVLFASRLYREKGIYEFLDLARHLKGSNRRFVVVGAPDTGVKSSVDLARLQESVDAGDIEFWGHQDNMVRVFQQADIFVFPSTHPEGTPKVLIEAASCAVPAIVSDLAGCRSVVVDHKTGLVVSRPETQELAEAVTTLIENPLLRKDMGASARARVIREFSLAGVIGKLFAFADIEPRPKAVNPAHA